MLDHLIDIGFTLCDECACLFHIRPQFRDDELVVHHLIPMNKCDAKLLRDKPSVLYKGDIVASADVFNVCRHRGILSSLEFTSRDKRTHAYPKFGFLNPVSTLGALPATHSCDIAGLRRSVQKI